MCGSYFGHCYHPPRGSFVQPGRPIREGDWVIVAGHISSVKLASRAMGIDWMTLAELCQAIPPAYTEFLGRELMRVCEANNKAEQ